MQNLYSALRRYTNIIKFKTVLHGQNTHTHTHTHTIKVIELGAVRPTFSVSLVSSQNCARRKASAVHLLRKSTTLR